jgi:outer membrane protein assembly factor BamB
MRARAAVVVAVIAVFAFGCAKADSNDYVNPERPLWAHRPSGALDIFARRTLTASSRQVGEDYERGRPEIDAAHGRVFVGSSDHGLYALRASNLSTIWRFETVGAVQCEPLYDPEMDFVYFGSNDGALYGVHASDGRMVWRFNSGAEVAKKPVRVGDSLYFANAADNLFAIDRRTGKMRWTQHRTPALGMEVSGYAGPAFDAGRIFQAYSDGHVQAYDARDGSEAWPAPIDLAGEAETAAGGEAPRYLDVDTTPVITDIAGAGRVMFVAGYAGGVYALGVENGGQVWKNDKAVGVTELFLFYEPAHDLNAAAAARGEPRQPERRILLASSGTTGLWALDATTGRSIWRLPIPEGGITAPVQVSGALAVGTTRYGFFLLSPLNGKVIDGFDTGTGFAQTPSAFGNRIYVMSNAGTMLGIDVNGPHRKHGG